MKPFPSLSNTLKASTISSGVGVLHLAGHHGELREINGSVSVGIDFVDHVLKLSLSRVLSERRMTVPNSFVVMVPSPSLSKGECLLELSNLLLGQ